MGWLSLATRVIPKLWRSGAKVTSTLWKGGSSVVGAVAKNPKTTAVASVATFAGWQKLSHPDESIGTAVGKTLRGGTDRTGDFAHDVVNGYTGENTVEQVKDTTNKVISEIKDTAAETKGLLGPDYSFSICIKPRSRPVLRPNTLTVTVTFFFSSSIFSITPENPLNGPSTTFTLSPTM